MAPLTSIRSPFLALLLKLWRGLLPLAVLATVLLWAAPASALYPVGSCRSWTGFGDWGDFVYVVNEARLEHSDGGTWTVVETSTQSYWQADAGEILAAGAFSGTQPAGTYRVKLVSTFYANAYYPLTPTEIASWPAWDTYVYEDHSTSFACGANAPTITSTPIEGAYVGVGYEYDAEASDPGDTFSFEGVWGPSGMTIDATTGLVEWTPTANDLPRRSAVFRVVDSTGLSDVQGFSVAVSSGGNLAPQIVSSGPTSANEGVAYSYQAESQDAVGDTATWSLVAAPAGMTIGSSTGLVSWTPTSGQVGVQSVTVRVTDQGALYDEEQYEIDVSATSNQAPAFDSTPLLVATEDTNYLYDCDAHDDGGLVTFSLDIAPLGMTIDPSTGIVNWLPRNFHVGTLPVVIRATDGTGLFTTQPFDVVVSNANSAPRIVSHAPTIASVGQSYAYDVDAVDVDANDELSYELTSAPAGMTINASTGLVAFTPTAGQIGPQTATVRVSDLGDLADLQTVTVHVRSAGPPIADFRMAKGRNVSLAAEGGSVVEYSSQQGVFVAVNAISPISSWVASNTPTPYLIIDLAGDLQVVDRFFLTGGTANDA